MPLGVVPDHTDLFSWILLHELLEYFDSLCLIASLYGIDLTFPILLIEESEIILMLTTPFSLDDSSFSFN